MINHKNNAKKYLVVGDKSGILREYLIKHELLNERPLGYTLLVELSLALTSVRLSPPT